MKNQLLFTRAGLAFVGLFGIAVPLVVVDICRAQLPLPVLDKVKKIRLLESDRSEVEALLAADSFDYSNADNHYQTFWMYDSIVRVFYSNGTCERDERGGNDWDVPEGKVIQVDVSPKASYPITQLRIDLSKLKKERTDWHRKGYYVYFDRAQEAAFFVRQDFVDTIEFIPAKSQFQRLCKVAEVLDYYGKNKWLRYPQSKKAIIDYNFPANVQGLKVSQSDQNKRQYIVVTTAVDPENDVLTYNYVISGGRIVGSGAKVIWDVSGVPMGTYTITAGVDDGCGICGQTMTKKVTIR